MKSRNVVDLDSGMAIAQHYITRLSSCMYSEEFDYKESATF
jgi:hypothetical protein